MASFPLDNIFSVSVIVLSSTSLPYHDGYVRADLPAERAPSAGLFSFPGCIKISLAVNLFSDFEKLLRTGDRAEPTPLASLPVNFDLGHRSSFFLVVYLKPFKNNILVSRIANTS